MINVVAALILKENKFLVSKRAHGELKDKWEFPGGKIEDNETKEDAIKREILEELFIDIKPIKVIADFNHKYSFNEINLTLMFCELENKNQNIKSDGSHSNNKWINFKSTPKLEFAPLDYKIYLYIKNNWKNIKNIY